MSEATQKKFRKLVRKLGQLLREESDRGLAAAESQDKATTDVPPWVSAFVDARWFADAEGGQVKFRLVMPDNSLYGLLDTTTDMENLLRKLWSVRKEDSSVKWYGLKVAVTPDGVITHELDNDPNCVVDPTWFKS